jgi:D-xylose 1-dehydrogenase (NADP+, D-xylono-1,5-lactone-forming)
MAKLLRWGILGTGNIARQFSAGVNACQRGRLMAVGSRSEDSARQFAGAYGIPVVHGSYDATLADPAIDAVYVSLPNSMHHQWTIKALRAGKHVLCEKPLAASAAEAREMFDEARRAGRVLVEGFMFRAHPLTHAFMKAIADGAIGQVRLIRTSFCYRTTRIAGNIRFDSTLAGGALMDIGCYCINFSRMVAGAEPEIMQAAAQLHPSGVDEVTVGFMQFGGGLLASFTCGMSVQADNAAHICGTEGYIEVPVPWKPPVRQAAWTVARSTPPRMDQPASKAPAPPPREMFHVDAGADLYALEADHFAATILDGDRPLMTEQDSLGNMRVLDEMRRQVGVG